MAGAGALRLPKLVYGTISRTCWHVALLYLAAKVFWGVYLTDLTDVGFEANATFIVAAVAAAAACYPILAFLVRDERLTNGVYRDLGIGLFYLFLLAPMLSVEMLPELPIDRDTFSAIGTQVQKGMVTRQHLDVVHKQLWEVAERNDNVPWKLASTTMFAPMVRIKLPRNDIEHSTRHITRVKMGETIKEYDLLMLKFWVPLSASSLEDELGEEAGAGDATGDAAGEGDGKADRERKSDEAGAADGTADTKADGDAAKEAGGNGTTADAGDEHAADSASFVYLVARTTPKLKLWPHPKYKSKKKQARVMGQTVDVCGKLFNGVPGGDPVDAAAAKLGRNLREDPNSLAFSLRTEYCSNDPIIFGPSGRAIYWMLLPIFLILRVILHFYSTTILMEHEEQSLRDEVGEIFRTLRAAYVSVYHRFVPKRD